MTRRRVTVLITDLDNTLYDWVEMWARGFEPFLAKLAAASGISPEGLKPAIKRVHEKHGTSEYAFVVEELEILQERFPGKDLRKHFAEAIHARRSAYRQHLRLYPGVRATLEALRARGTRIVGYTESRSYYAADRVRQLGLDGLLDFVYTQPDHELPESSILDEVRSHPPEYYKLVRTEQRLTPEGELKPNPHILRTILAECGHGEDCAVYVGDSLMKDVAMAQEAGVVDVFAKYGSAQDRPEYELLRDVTHWKREAVEKERALLASPSITPTVVLLRGFSELLDVFEFAAFDESKALPQQISIPRDPRDDPELKAQFLVEAWKKTVDVQQHFNDLQVRIRTFAITFVAAVLGLVGLALKEDSSSILAGTFLTIGAVAWLAFYMMDRWWYHRLLEGAVRHGQSVEGLLETSLGHSGFALAGSIKKASPVSLPKNKRMTSRNKADLFYFLFLGLFIVGAVVLFDYASRQSAGRPKPSGISTVVAPTANAPTSGTPTPRPESSGVPAAPKPGALPVGKK